MWTVSPQAALKADHLRKTSDLTGCPGVVTGFRTTPDSFFEDLEMKIRMLHVSSRNAVLEIEDGGIYHTKEPYRIRLNGKTLLTTEKVITNLFGLFPSTEYHLEVCASGTVSSLDFCTGPESVTLNVRDFGAAGDGEKDDTLFIQAAVAACPPDGRVLIPKGRYRICCLFLKSNLKLCLEKDAVLVGNASRGTLPLLPGMVETWDEKDEFNLGTWEGNPLVCHTGILTGLYLENVEIHGEGTIDGGASPEGWWKKDQTRILPARPRLLFLNHCRHVVLQGLLFTNSPSWNLHPYFCEDVAFYGTEVINPADSPNTDGMDPESCSGVRILGMHFSVGDDCIAVKAGKIYMGKTYRTPCRDIEIRQCFLENGHGAVTLGSEMAGGILDMKVEDCLFRNTDRGFRLKTRRGRGKDAVVDGIRVRNVRMEQVKTPLVVNSFYYCDPDGHTSYVQQREGIPADERTPDIRRLSFENIRCTDCHVQAAYIEGLPEKKIGELALVHVHVSFAEDALPGQPAMTEGAGDCCRKGFFAANTERLILRDVTVEGQEGDPFILAGNERVEQE